MTEHADEKGREKAKAALLRPVPGRRKVSAGVVDYERRLFAASLAKYGSG